MDEHEKATRQVVDEIFDNLPELFSIRDLVEDEIKISYTRVQAVIYFMEGLYRAGKEYEAIVNLAPSRLKAEISLNETHWGIPTAKKDRMYREFYKAILEILSPTDKKEKSL